MTVHVRGDDVEKAVEVARLPEVRKIDLECLRAYARKAGLTITELWALENALIAIAEYEGDWSRKYFLKTPGGGGEAFDLTIKMRRRLERYGTRIHVE